VEDAIKKLLDRAWHAYDSGKPFMSDAAFDTLVAEYGYDDFGSEPDIKAKHLYKMYSLQKVYDSEPEPSTMQGISVCSPKLDGAAISLIYVDGTLVNGITRGRDGVEGEDITQNIYHLVQTEIALKSIVQITGEVVCDKEIDNARNFAAGSVRLKDVEEFKERAKHLNFIAYGLQPYQCETYVEDMHLVEDMRFFTVFSNEIEDQYRMDGEVHRLNDNKLFKELGYTAKHPRGAYARKQSSDVAIVETTLLKVEWGVGRTGKVTPVAIFETINIDDANISRATLNNAGFIEEMELEIGDTILVTRAGGIIPKVIGRV